MEKLTKQIADEANKLKARKKSYTSYLMSALGCSRDEAIDALAVWNSAKTKAKLTTTPEEIYIDYGKYKVNKNTGDYLIPLKSTGKTQVYSKDQIQSLLTAYSNFAGGNGSTIDQICRVHSIPRSVFTELKSVLGWTHDKPPITEIDLETKSEAQLLEHLNLQKLHNVSQQFQAKQWESIMRDALKYRDIQLGISDPLAQALERFDPNNVPSIKPAAAKTKSSFGVSGDVMLITLSDLHYGLLAHGGALFFGSDYNTGVAQRFVEQYFSKIKQHLANRKVPIKKAVIVSAGDILHSLTGFTMNGTKMKTDLLGSDQFNAALESLTMFVQGVAEVFDDIEVHSVNGNHAGFSDAILFTAIKNAFRTYSNIRFFIYEATYNSFLVGNTYILLTHGASAKGKHLVPQKDPHRELFFTKAINEDAHRDKKAKASVVIQGDQHHLERKDYGSFEFIMLPSILNGCDHADDKGFNTKPRQVCFVLGAEGGIKEQIDFRLE